jgi:hypothetical protein
MNLAGRQLNRREALVGGAGLVGGSALAALMTAPAVAASDGPTGLEGAWLIDVTPDPGTGTIAPHRVLVLYTKGGGVAGISDGDPTTGSTGFGAWQSVGDDRFLETFELFTFDSGRHDSGILQIRASSVLDESRDHMTGQALIYFQPIGAPSFFPVGSTHFTGSRIKPMPL